MKSTVQCTVCVCIVFTMQDLSNDMASHCMGPSPQLGPVQGCHHHVTTSPQPDSACTCTCIYCTVPVNRSDTSCSLVSTILTLLLTWESISRHSMHGPRIPGPGSFPLISRRPYLDTRLHTSVNSPSSITI